jgi:hypothetical protein
MTRRDNVAMKNDQSKSKSRKTSQPFEVIKVGIEEFVEGFLADAIVAMLHG